MTLGRYFCPKAYVESIAEVDINELKRNGIKGLIIDLDNTLVEWNGDVNLMSHGVREWLTKAKEEGFRLCLVSNGLNERVTIAGQTLGIPVVSSAAKPRRRPFLLALEKMGTGISDTAVIGDQLFTDIFGGNRVGLYTVLVKPISQHEFCATRIVRRLERILLSCMEKRGHISLREP
jgi:HAD superfamily phosphatase (TIGR01668 family)